jgi:hypothetical protein
MPIERQKRLPKISASSIWTEDQPLERPQHPSRDHQSHAHPALHPVPPPTTRQLGR